MEQREETMKSHEIDYEIFGDEMQLVEVALDPGETVIAEAGAMSYMEDGIPYGARTGD
ncbi:MAG: AIM24 family protein [Spirochaetaceae bacterium]